MKTIMPNPGLAPDKQALIRSSLDAGIYFTNLLSSAWQKTKTVYVKNINMKIWKQKYDYRYDQPDVYCTH